MKALSRHTIDLIARAVVSGHRGYGKRVDGIADFVSGLMRNRLKAVGARGAKRTPRVRQHDPTLRDRRLLSILLDRTEKHLAWTALAESTGGIAQPR